MAKLNLPLVCVMEVLDFLVNFYLVTILLTFAVVFPYGLYRNRGLGLIVAANFVITGATMASVFWPLLLIDIMCGQPEHIETD